MPRSCATAKRSLSLSSAAPKEDFIKPRQTVVHLSNLEIRNLLLEIVKIGHPVELIMELLSANGLSGAQAFWLLVHLRGGHTDLPVDLVPFDRDLRRPEDRGRAFDLEENSMFGVVGGYFRFSLTMSNKDILKQVARELTDLRERSAIQKPGTRPRRTLKIARDVCVFTFRRTNIEETEELLDTLGLPPLSKSRNSDLKLIRQKINFDMKKQITRASRWNSNWT